MTRLEEKLEVTKQRKEHQPLSNYWQITNTLFPSSSHLSRISAYFQIFNQLWLMCLTIQITDYRLIKIIVYCCGTDLFCHVWFCKAQSSWETCTQTALSCFTQQVNRTFLKIFYHSRKKFCWKHAFMILTGFTHSPLAENPFLLVSPSSLIYELQRESLNSLRK